MNSFHYLQLIDDQDLTVETSDHGRDDLVVQQTPMVNAVMRTIKKREMTTNLPGIVNDSTTGADIIIVENQPIKQMIVPLIDQEMKLNLTQSRKKNRTDDHLLGETDEDHGKACF